MDVALNGCIVFYNHYNTFYYETVNVAQKSHCYIKPYKLVSTKFMTT